jgi:hypothetical protein
MSGSAALALRLLETCLLGLGVVVGLGLVARGGPAAAAGNSPGSKPLTPSEEAKAVLLTQADMPSGWVATPVGKGPTHIAPLSETMARCIRVSSSVATVKPLKVSSPDFTAPDHTAAVEDSASVYATVAQASAAYKAMANRRTPSCMASLGAAALQTSIEAEAGHGAVVDSISIGPLATGSLPAHETGFNVHIPLTLHGKNLTIDSTQVDFQRGAVLQQLTFNGNGAPFTPLEQVHLLQIATGHP